MEGVAAKAEAMAAEHGGMETAGVQRGLGRVGEAMVGECFVIYTDAGSRD